MDTAITLDTAAVASIIATVLVVGIALAGLILRSTSRLDADRRETQRWFDASMDAFRAEAHADRRETQQRFDASMDAFQASMDIFRADMRRLAERQSHVEGRLDERGSAAD